MVNPIEKPILAFVTIFNSLPVAVRNFISFSLFIFLFVAVFRLLWRVKG